MPEPVPARPVPTRSRADAKRETREALLLAGLAEFAERGLAEPSLDAICARAGFTRGAFYVHFRDRDDFISAAVERVLGPFLDSVIATGDEERDLDQTIERFAEVLALGPEGLPGGAAGIQLQRLLEACARSEAIRGRLAELLEGAIARVASAAAEGQRSGSVRADVDAAAVGSVLVALALGAINARELGVRFDLAPAREAVRALLRVEG